MQALLLDCSGSMPEETVRKAYRAMNRRLDTDRTIFIAFADLPIMLTVGWIPPYSEVRKAMRRAGGTSPKDAIHLARSVHPDCEVYVYSDGYHEDVGQWNAKLIDVTKL